jgi:hypothetical protein
LNVLVRSLPADIHKALPKIAAIYDLGSTNEVILWALGAFVQTVRENDTLLDAAIRISEESDASGRLPERIKVSA